MDFVVGAGGLPFELIAGNVDDFEALVVEVGIHLFYGLVMRSETAAGRGVHDEHHLALEVCERDLVALAVGEGEIVDGCHDEPPFFRCRRFIGLLVFAVFDCIQFNFIKFIAESQ